MCGEGVIAASASAHLSASFTRQLPALRFVERIEPSALQLVPPLARVPDAQLARKSTTLALPGKRATGRLKKMSIFLPGARPSTGRFRRRSNYFCKTQI
jgi:hypothetical protein